MALTKLGLNISAVADIPQFELNISNSSSEILAQLPSNANSITGDIFTFAVMMGMFIAITWILSDNSPFANFRYSEARSISISLAITSNTGILFLMIGWFSSLSAIGFYQVLYILSLIFIALYENRE